MRLCASADAVLDAVEEATASSPGPVPRDLNDAFLGAAYGRAYRCMRSIRELACRGEGDDAMILTRSLLLIVGTSLYVTQPDDDVERVKRMASWRLSYAIKMGRTYDDLSGTGFDPDDNREGLRRIEEHETGLGTKPLPNDHDLLAALGLSAYYARVYRVASDIVHYSIGSALDGFVEYPRAFEGGGRVILKKPDAERSEEALALALTTYGEFLERCEPTVRHGLTPVVRRLLADYLNAKLIGEGEQPIQDTEA
jgi:hypothetical protein